MTLGEWLVVGAVGGPAVAALAWLALSRWRWGRRAGGGAVAVASHAAAWGVFWLAYNAEEVGWRGLRPDLLDATIVVAAELAILLAAVRAETRGAHAPAELPAALVALGVAAAGVAAIAYADSLVLVALLLPIPALAAGVAAISGAGPADVRGLLGLAAADAAALAGLSIVYASSDTVAFTAVDGVGAALVVAGAAAKAGAVPGVATWRIAATDGPAAPVAVALRGQGNALVALACLHLGATGVDLAAAAAAAVALSGIAAVVATRPAAVATAAVGAAAGIPFLALGLGGATGVRAFLLAFPAFLIAAGAAHALAWPGRGADEGTVPRRVRWRGPSAVALGVTLGSLLALPPGGGFPGTWLALSLATVRAEAAPAWLAIAGAAGLGLALAAIAALPLVRAAVARPAVALAGTVAALTLLYIGTQPVRLGIGWWLRVEGELAAATLLPSAGTPSLPPLGGSHLLLAAAPALGLVALLVALGRGVRAAEPSFAPLIPRPPRRGAAGRPAAVPGRSVDAVRRLSAAATEAAAGFGVALVLEVAALVLAARLVLLGAQTGFL